MIPADLKQVAEGDILVSPHTSPPLKPMKVTHTWVSASGTIARIKFVGEKDWRDAASWEYAPAGLVWSTTKRRWLAPAPMSNGK